jgi:hypothetical protein
MATTNDERETPPASDNKVSDPVPSQADPKGIETFSKSADKITKESR